MQPHRRVASRFILGLTSLGVLACTDSSKSPSAPDQQTTTHVRNATLAASAAVPLTLDERWAQIAHDVVPGFAGMIALNRDVDEVLLTDESQLPRAKAYVQEVRRKAGMTPGTVRSRRVDYAFDELMTWRLQLLPLLGVQRFHFLDIDEARNRLVLGVTSAAHIERIRRLAANAGVPTGAVIVEVVPIGRARVLLTETAPSIIGGYEIRSPAGTCTLGFNTYAAGSTGAGVFITASHCSTQQFVTEGTAFTQINWSAGSETNDPGLVGGYLNFNGHSWVCNYNCRFSDATLVTYNAGIPYQQGALAKTTGYGIGQRGSTEVAQPWKIFNKLTMEYLNVGRWLNKVGRTSGWTRGQVTRTCFDDSDGDRTLLCQWEAGIWSEQGDSGSPIFLDGDSEPPADVTYVHLAGLLWGGPPGDWTITWFSVMDALDRDFGMSFRVCSPDIASC
jgi:hypothetical protein